MTETHPFQPLTDRLAGLPVDQTLHDGVPGWLDRPLRESIQTAFEILGESHVQEHLARRVVMRLRWTLGNPREQYRARLLNCLQADLLTVLDAVLQLHPGHEWPPSSYNPWEEVRTEENFLDYMVGVQSVLTDAGSLYKIDYLGRCLIRRVDATVQEAVGQAITAAPPSAADHLKTAWTAAYGLHPDPDKAYDHAILALEDLACPLVCPNNTRATLGVVISDLRNQSAQWELDIGDTSSGQPASINSVIQMIELLWKGQSRHGGNPNSRKQTQAEAESAVHMATALVQWLTTGILHRKT